MTLPFSKGQIIDLSLVVIKGILCHYYSALSIFSAKMGHPQPIKAISFKVSQIIENIWYIP